MATYTWDAIYLGNYADMDPDDADFTAENAEDLLGTYGSMFAPLYNNVVSVVADDANENTDLDYDDPNETLVIDGVSNQLDSGAVFNATITYADGTTAQITAMVLQTDNGDLYLAPEITANADQAAMEAGPIMALTLDSVAVETTRTAANRSQTDFVCVANGAMIATPQGPVAIENLQVGDLVDTQDNGAQPIRWIGQKRIGICRQITQPSTAPIVIQPDAIGPGAPMRTLLVSQQHRILLESPIAQRMYGTQQVLVIAKKLTNLPGFAVAQNYNALTYFHLAFDKHEVIFANGAPVESLLFGPQACDILGAELIAQIEKGQTLAGRNGLPTRPCRVIATGPKSKQFLRRLSEKSKRDRATDMRPTRKMPCLTPANAVPA